MAASGMGFCGRIARLPGGLDHPLPLTDLVAMADANLNYLLRTPRPHLGHACRFCNYLSFCPPHPGGNDSIANGDSDCRMDWEYPFMREMTGRTDGLEIDAGVRKRVLGYLDGDGYAHADGGIYCGGEPRAGESYISTWTGGKILYTLADTYARTGDAEARQLARRVFQRLITLASTRDGLAWYEGGAGPWRDGRWFDTFITCNYGVASEPLLHYARCCGDAEALDWAVRFARGSVAGVQANLGIRRVQPDGTFGDQVHLHTHEAWGVADVGLHTGDADLLGWAERLYAFVRSRGGDSGFFPEKMILPDTRCWDGHHDRAFISETCITADMVDIALCLARAGRVDYFDHAERYVRNYLRTGQFRLTPAVEAWYRQRHAERPMADVEAGLAMLRHDYDGAFLGHIGLTDWLHDAASVPDLTMAGCCVPEGMRAIHAVWRAAAEETDSTVRINMPFDRDLPSARIRCTLGDVGRIVVEMHRSCTALHVRPPAWLDWPALEVRVNHEPIEAAALRQEAPAGYLALSRPQAGQRIEVIWPQPCFEQHITWGGQMDAPRQATFRWKGNTILAAHAEGEIGMFRLYGEL